MEYLGHTREREWVLGKFTTIMPYESIILLKDIRLYPEDIETLFGAVEIRTPVTIIDMPYKLGWQGDALYLEITPT